MRTGVVLLNSSSPFTGAVQSTPQQWIGGRSCVLIDATQYSPGGVQLQVQNNSGTWVNVASSFVANQLFPFDAPPGQYRVANASGSSVAVTAFLGPIPYNV